MKQTPVTPLLNATDRARFATTVMHAALARNLGQSIEQFRASMQQLDRVLAARKKAAVA